MLMKLILMDRVKGSKRMESALMDGVRRDKQKLYWTDTLKIKKEICNFFSLTKLIGLQDPSHPTPIKGYQRGELMGE